jgi:hypothetical protein
MPCYRCGTRQVDPDRGSSPWQRAVRADRQVLICPGCQETGGWTADLDRCTVCGSIRLVRRLGEVECRECGAVRDSIVTAQPAPSLVDDVPQGLAEEVEQALARVLRRSPARPGPAEPGPSPAPVRPGGEVAPVPCPAAATRHRRPWEAVL